MLVPIPAIDIIDGRCVRLTKGDYASEKVYADDPSDMARRFEDYGFRRLHVVDLDGARSRHIVNHRALEQIVLRTNLIVDFGGGIKQEDDLRMAFDFGAQMVTVGSLAATAPERVLGWAEHYGSEHFIVGADVEGDDIRINGWQESGGLKLEPFLRRYHEAGLRQVLCTDIAQDGTLKGPSSALYRHIMEMFPDLNLIASGGISSIEDLYALNEASIPAAVFGKAIYEGRIDLREVASAFL